MPRQASVARQSPPAHRIDATLPPHVVGTGLAAGGCALFWTILLHVAGPAVGIELNGATLAVICMAIALFLTAVLRLLASEK